MAFLGPALGWVMEKNERGNRYDLCPQGVYPCGQNLAPGGQGEKILSLGFLAAVPCCRSGSTWKYIFQKANFVSV